MFVLFGCRMVIASKPLPNKYILDSNAQKESRRTHCASASPLVIGLRLLDATHTMGHLIAGECARYIGRIPNGTLKEIPAENDAD